MRIKGGVRVHGIEPEVVLAMVIAHQLYVERGEPFVITSVTEGEHQRGSLHYRGGAFDLRLRALADREVIASDLADRLGDDYDVVLETTHLHVEFQPKRSY